MLIYHLCLLIFILSYYSKGGAAYSVFWKSKSSFRIIKPDKYPIHLGSGYCIIKSIAKVLSYIIYSVWILELCNLWHLGFSERVRQTKTVKQTRWSLLCRWLLGWWQHKMKIESNGNYERRWSFYSLSFCFDWRFFVFFVFCDNFIVALSILNYLMLSGFGFTIDTIKWWVRILFQI